MALNIANRMLMELCPVMLDDGHTKEIAIAFYIT